MKWDSKAFVRKYDVCQRFGNAIYILAEMLYSTTSPWPFYKWGIDVVGPLPLATGQRKFMLVATDYFTKWVETKAYAHIRATQLFRFVQKNLVCRFGVPHSLISDNGLQFIIKAFQQFCTEYGIKNVYSLPRYP